MSARIRMRSGDFFAATAAAELSASSDILRPNLNAVHFQLKAGALRVAGTNGHWATTWRQSAEGDDCEILIPLEAIKAARRHTKSLQADLPVVICGETRTIEQSGCCLTFASRGGVIFPPVDAAFPKRRRMVRSFNFNPDLIAKAGTAFTASAKARGVDLRSGVHIEMTGLISPIHITAVELPELAAIVMPMRECRDPSPQSIRVKYPRKKKAAVKATPSSHGVEVRR